VRFERWFKASEYGAIKAAIKAFKIGSFGGRGHLTKLPDHLETGFGQTHHVNHFSLFLKHEAPGLSSPRDGRALAASYDCLPSGLRTRHCNVSIVP